MSVFRLYLWKEWREQRQAVLALLGMLPVLVLAIAGGWKARQVSHPYFALFCGLLSLATVLLAIGAELLGQDRRAREQWLERLPAGLAGAYPAKLALFALTSTLALGYGLGLASLGAALRGRPALDFLDLAVEAPLIALLALGAAAVLATWTFAASAWCGRGMIALLVGGLVVGGMALVARHFALLGFTPPLREVLAVTVVLALAGLVSARVGFVQGRRLGRGPLATAARGLPAGALCVLPVAGWSLHQLRDRVAFDLAAPDCYVYGAWISGNGRVALLYAVRENERWEDERSHVVRVDFEHRTYRVIGGPGARWAQVAEDIGQTPLQEPEEIWVEGEELSEPLVLDSLTGELVPGASGESTASMGRFRCAGHGFAISDGDSYVQELVDPYHGLRVRPSELGIEAWWRVRIGPETWLIETWPQWLEYSPECAELASADWMEPAAEAGLMLADGRLLVRLLDEETYALADPEARRLVRLTGGGRAIGGPSFLQEGGLHPGEPAFVHTVQGRHRLDEERLELVPCDDSYAGELLRWLPDGTLFFLTDEGLYRRDPDGMRTCAFSFADAVQEVAP